MPNKEKELEAVSFSLSLSLSLVLDSPEDTDMMTLHFKHPFPLVLNKQILFHFTASIS